MLVKKTNKILWGVFVLVALYYHLLIGTLLAIATAFYWLLERHLGKSPAESSAVDKPSERLWCVMGEHWIGSEPYSFYPETEYHSADEAYCLKCKEASSRRIDRMLQDGEERKTKAIEWERLTEDEREARRIAAKQCGTCPRCDRELWLTDSDVKGSRHSKGSCPLCHEFPFRIGASMNGGWREKEWASLSETEKQARIEAVRKKRDANRSEWAIKGDDGVWRRKDNGDVVERDDSDAIEAAKARYGWSEELQPEEK
jgi:hypothetical protein